MTGRGVAGGWGLMLAEVGLGGSPIYLAPAMVVCDHEKTICSPIGFGGSMLAAGLRFSALGDAGAAFLAAAAGAAADARMALAGPRRADTVARVVGFRDAMAPGRVAKVSACIVLVAWVVVDKRRASAATARARPGGEEGGGAAARSSSGPGPPTLGREEEEFLSG